MTEQELMKAMPAPFQVVSKADQRKATIEGFSENDPLGVGGGLLPNMATVHFKGGGWCLLSDFLQHWDLPPNAQAQPTTCRSKAKAGRSAAAPC